MWAVLWKVAPVRSSLLCNKQRKYPSDVNNSSALGLACGFWIYPTCSMQLVGWTMLFSNKTTRPFHRGGRKRERAREAEELGKSLDGKARTADHFQADSPPVLPVLPCVHAAFTLLHLTHEYKKERRGVYKWYILLTYCIRFLLNYKQPWLYTSQICIGLSC